MSMKREDFIRQGHDDAARGLKPAYHRPGTWQERAYSEGYATPAHPQADIVADIAHWPAAAQAHAKYLRDSIQKEDKRKRRERLLRALERLARRHGPATHQNVHQRDAGDQHAQ